MVAPISKNSVKISNVVSEDLHAISGHYASEVVGGVATFDTTIPPLSYWESKLRASQTGDYPFLVARQIGREHEVCGWFSLSPYDAKEAYARCAEFSVYVLADFQGRGIGKRLMERMLKRCRITQQSKPSSLELFPPKLQVLNSTRRSVSGLLERWLGSETNLDRCETLAFTSTLASYFLSLFRPIRNRIDNLKQGTLGGWVLLNTNVDMCLGIGVSQNHVENALDRFKLATNKHSAIARGSSGGGWSGSSGSRWSGSGSGSRWSGLERQPLRLGAAAAGTAAVATAVGCRRCTQIR